MISALREAIVNHVHNLLGIDVYFLLAPASQPLPYLVFSFADITPEVDTLGTGFKIEVFFNFYSALPGASELMSDALALSFETVPNGFTSLGSHSVFGISPLPVRIMRNGGTFITSRRFYFFTQS